MLIAGFVNRKALAKWQDIPHLLPQFQFYEKHRAVISTTCPEKILPIVAGFDIQRDVVIRTLMSVRQLPQKLQSHQPGKAIPAFGLHSFTLLESTPTELSYGLKGRFWRADFGLENAPDASAYQAEPGPGRAKLLLRYRVTALPEGKHELCTETFIHCPDRATRLKMAAYWLVIRAGSGWIRQRMLKAVKSALEEAGRQSGDK
ncbi:hypothetical protein [Dryocola sp. BD613]|uniref:hypothetical protein n=1 Tax=Dryocola sp. BD613 TaxID=3133272 RepID=UPI003F50376B